LQIELANGLENDSYAESIQRLSDLEWLLHKQSQESIVDDLFTGQLVEALLCTSNNRISVSLQTFNVLPVPLAAPRPVSGLVLLEDCFTAFCHIEHLANTSTISGAADLAWNTGGVGVRGSRSAEGAASGVGVTPQSAQQGPRTRSSARLAAQAMENVPPTPLGRILSVMSPIVGQSQQFVNDSGFCDNAFKTSTPIRDIGGGGGESGGGGGSDGGDVQRRCLLRQLPECLIIQLMRFQYSVQQARPTKLRAPVSVRLKGLDLQALVYDTVTQREDLAAPAGMTGPHVYDLYGLCLHLGADSTHHGHYISYSLAADGFWYRFDDESVTQVNMEYELTTKEVRQNAYLLFYKRAAA
jgi:ubiquitin carboxyl-terminal hydrolase 8